MRRTRPPFIKTPGDGRKRFGDTELTQAFETDYATTAPSRRQVLASSSTSTSGSCTCDTSALEAALAAALARIEELEDAVDALETTFYHSLDFSKSKNSFYFPLVG